MLQKQADRVDDVRAAFRSVSRKMSNLVVKDQAMAMVQLKFITHKKRYFAAHRMMMLLLLLPGLPPPASPSQDCLISLTQDLSLFRVQARDRGR